MKDLKRRAKGFIDRHSRLSRAYAHTYARVKELSSLPRYCYHMVRGKPYFGEHMRSHQLEPERARFMKLLTRKAVAENGSLRMAEIGSWAGESAIVWAEAAKEARLRSSTRETVGATDTDAISIICIDPWRPFAGLQDNPLLMGMTRATQSDRIFPLFLHNIKSSGNADVIIPLRTESRLAACLFRPEVFDLVFIDGDHAYSSVASDIRNYAPLVRIGGYLCGDDLDPEASLVDQDFLRSHRDVSYRIRDPKTGHRVHPGVALAVGEYFGSDVSNYAGFWVVRRAGEKWQTVRL